MKIYSFCLLAVAAFITACSSNQNSKTITGTYSGTIPCADCMGIEKTLHLNKDKTFSLEAKYLETENVESFSSFGRYEVKEDTLILFNLEDEPNTYLVTNEYVEQLDIMGKKIESKANYKLFKVSH